MNSYQRALEIMSATPTVLKTVVASIPAESIDRPPAAGAWSAKQVLTHLLHVETAVIGERIRLMLAEENPQFQAVSPSVAPEDPQATLEAWLSARAANLGFLRTLTPTQLERTGRHPKYGTISVREHLVEWAYHDLDHLRQILATVQADIYPDIGVFRALYPPPA